MEGEKVGMSSWVRASNHFSHIVLAVGLIATISTVALAQSPDASQKKLSNLLTVPLPGKLIPEEAATIYKADSLYQYIDGGADVYLSYDFRALLHQDLKGGSAEVSADIYDMGTSEDAFGIYAAERSPKYKFVPIGIEGYRSKGILNFVQDHYYVKLLANGVNADPLLDPLARMLSQQIGGAHTAPPLLLKLPPEHKVERSEQYVRKDPLGHPFLAPSYIATYAWGSQEGKLIVSVADDSAGAKSRLEQLVKHFKQTGTSTEAKDLGEDGIRAKNSFEGNWIAKTQGRYLIALVNPPANGAGILNSTAQGLR
jgi:hypothetical protein